LDSHVNWDDELETLFREWKGKVVLEH
jgi:hypothetical protein